MRRLRSLVCFLGVTAIAHASAPLLPELEKLASTLPAGGFVLAEVEGAAVNYSRAGQPAGSISAATEQLVFEIGSITKVFTGLLLAQASLEGRVSLDDPIARYLPADLVLDPHVAAITLQQLSSHTSGLPRLPDNLEPYDPVDPYAGYSVERLYTFLRSHRLAQPAPQPSAYSNLGVGLLGHLLERIYGRSYAELVREKITGPLEMNDTAIALSEEQRARFVTPYSGSAAVSPWALGALEGAGALRSTAADLAKFIQAVLDENSPIAAAWRVAAMPRAPHGARGRIGLGIMLAQRGDDTVYYHGGGTGGFRSYLEIVPSQRRGTVLLLNNDAPEPGAVVAALRRPAPAAPAPVATPGAEQLTPDELAAYTGIFRHDERVSFTFVLDEDKQLRARLTGQPFLPLQALGGDRFRITVVAAEYQFHRDADSRLARVVLHQNGNELPASRTGEAPAILFPPVENLRDYAGSYELAPNMIFDITAGKYSLAAKLTGQPTFAVHCIRPDHFVYDVVDAAFTFERDEQGAVVALILHQHGLDQRAPRRSAAK